MDALQMREPEARTAAASAQIGTFAIGALRPSPLNPRKRFDDASMTDLAANIARHGVIVPLIGRRQGDDIEIVDGERRYRAALEAGQLAVPVVLRDDLTDGEVIEIQLLSAIQRQDLTPLEEARGYQALIASNPSRYSAAYIADRISRSEKYVWDRMKLLDLIPPAAAALEAERLLVGHAEILAKLKPEDQRRALTPPSGFHDRSGGGLWVREAARLDFTNEDAGDEDDDEYFEPDGDDLDASLQALAKGGWRGLKPVTVKELEAWVATHVRFDVEHFATAAPLDFGTTKTVVDEAKAQPGRGKKLVAITHEYRVPDEARDPAERTYGYQAWKRADGEEGSQTCDHRVLGVVVAGRGYGSTLHVCIAKDKCETHWAKEMRDRAKTQRLRASGKSAQAAQREAAAEAKRKAEAEAKAAAQKAWNAISGACLKAAIDQVRTATSLTPAQAKAIEVIGRHGDAFGSRDAVEHLGAQWYRRPAAALLAMAICNEGDSWRCDSFEDFERDVIKRFGLNPKPFATLRAPQGAGATTTAAVGKKAKAAPAKAKKSAAAKKTPSAKTAKAKKARR